MVEDVLGAVYAKTEIRRVPAMLAIMPYDCQICLKPGDAQNAQSCSDRRTWILCFNSDT